MSRQPGQRRCWKTQWPASDPPVNGTMTAYYQSCNLFRILLMGVGRYRRCRLLRVVEDDAQCMPPSLADAAYPVAHVDAIDAAGALHRPVMHREDHRLALGERHHLGAGLHARPLLGQHEL